MDRREFLKSTAAATAASAATATLAQSAGALGDPAGVAAPSLASGTKELRLAVAWPDAVAGPADQARRLGQRVATMSGGRYRIAFLSGVDDGLGAVRSGDADLYFASQHDHLGEHRALAYFSGLPGERSVSARHLSAWLQVGGGQQLWDELAAELGVKAMLAGHTGERPCFLSHRSVGDMRELAGEKVAVSGLARDVARGLGLEPVTPPPGRLAEVLADGSVLAAECGGAITSYALGLLRAASYSVGANLNRHGSALALGLSRSLWDSLSAGDQALFAAAAAAEYELALAEEEAHRRFLYPEPGAVKEWPLAQELSRAIGRVADAVVAHVATGDSQAQRINASYLAFRRALLPDETFPTREIV